MKTEILNIITRLENNIAKLEKEIASGYFQKGYNLNCQQTIESYKQQIKQLKNENNKPKQHSNRAAY